MIDPSAYPRPVPLSQPDALELARAVGQWADVPGTFLVYEMIGLAEREGEWRFAGAARSLAGVFDRLVEFNVAFGADPDAARRAVVDLIGSRALGVFPRLEDGWSAGPSLDPAPAHRVVFFGEAHAPHDNHGLCILEVEPEEGEPFFSRRPETHLPDEWFERGQCEQQWRAERPPPDTDERSGPARPSPEGDSEEIPF